MRLLLLVALAFAAEGAKNPHGATDGCTSCHAAGDDGATGPALPIVETCRGCHPTADMHPVGMAPDKVAIAPGFPLEDGKVTCATCHSEPAHGEPYASLPVPWHRGGPYSNIKDFCYGCHDATRYARQSPHQFEGIEATTGSCAACHTTPPEKGAGVAGAKLRTAAAEACTGCHEGQDHFGTAQHLGKTVPEHHAAMLPPTVPLLDGTIQCFTCHDVHDVGPIGHESSKIAAMIHEQAVKKEWKHVPPEAVWPNDHDPAMLALGTPELCQTCHGEGPE